MKPSHYRDDLIVTKMPTYYDVIQIVFNYVIIIMPYDVMITPILSYFDIHSFNKNFVIQ